MNLARIYDSKICSTLYLNTDVSTYTYPAFNS